ncbi:TonB-dependent receptor domain-containing protein, partial [Providencia rustigianii]
GQNQPRRDDFGLKIGKLSHRTSIKDGLGRHIGSCGPLNRNFPSRKINSEDYYLKYKYTPINELIDVELLASHGYNTQKFQGDPIGGALKNAESENKSDSINLSNTSHFSYGDADFKWQLGSKLMKTKYQKITQPVEDPNTIIYNPFSPSGTQDIASLYTQFEAKYDIYTATFDLNYLNYRVKGYKPACDATEKCFPQEASTLDLRESGINPGILISAQIIPEFQPFVSYAHSMRAPNSQEVFFSQNGGQSMNPFLKGEKSKTWQIGFNSFKPDFIVEGDQFNLKALWFHTHIKDYITSKSFMLCRATSQEEFDWCLINDDVWNKENPDIFQRADMYVNDPRDVNLRGYELQANYDAGVFYSMVSYTQESGKQPVSINSTSVFSAGDFTQLPEYYVTLDTGVRLFDEKLTIGSAITWTGPSKRISPIPDGDMNGDAMTEKYEKQPTIVDLYADYEINKNFKLMMTINNLTNENYTDVLNRANSGAIMEERGRNNETGRGRSYMLGGQVRF